MGHMQIDTDDKPYTCQVCGSVFSFNVNLIGHMQIDTEDKPYSCQLCSSVFYSM